jgi:hypothetical protein
MLPRESLQALAERWSTSQMIEDNLGKERI